MPELVLGPVLRYVDATRATVWVQTDAPCEVEVLGHRARTFAIDDHHFALVVIEGLEPGTRTLYRVTLDGRPVWPAAGDEHPPPVIPTPAGDGDPIHIVFGSCREVAPHHPPYTHDESTDPRGTGLDALRAYALELAGGEAERWPHALLMLGDQLYADEPPRRLHGALRDRPKGATSGVRATSFGDYARLYRESWCEPAVRWLLSTVPSLMIFDDHEIVDEWKISAAWLDERRGDPDYERRATDGLTAYWAFQHLGNLSPEQLAGDELFARVHEAEAAGEIARRFAADARQEVGESRWSFARRVGHAQVVVLDSRASRRLKPGARQIIDEREWHWAERTVREAAGEADHVLLATSLPYLLPEGLHGLEAAIERVGDGRWGPRAARGAERLRRALNLGHWASFQASFTAMARLLDETAVGRTAGSRPASVVLLSGDVHHGYLARWRPDRDDRAPVWQVVCSPFRKRVVRHEHAAMRAGHTLAARLLGRVLARLSGAGPPPADWRLCESPSYRNQIAALDLDGRQATVRLRVADGDWSAPRLRTLWERRLS